MYLGLMKLSSSSNTKRMVNINDGECEFVADVVTGVGENRITKKNV